jgi:hypothetical protein
MNSRGTSNGRKASNNRVATTARTLAKVGTLTNRRDALTTTNTSNSRDASNSKEATKQIHMSHHMTKSFTLHHFHVLLVTNSVLFTCILQYIYFKNAYAKDDV